VSSDACYGLIFSPRFPSEPAASAQERADIEPQHLAAFAAGEHVPELDGMSRRAELLRDTQTFLTATSQVCVPEELRFCVKVVVAPRVSTRCMENLRVMHAFLTVAPLVGCLHGLQNRAHLLPGLLEYRPAYAGSGSLNVWMLARLHKQGMSVAADTCELPEGNTSFLLLCAQSRPTLNAFTRTTDGVCMCRSRCCARPARAPLSKTATRRRCGSPSTPASPSPRRASAPLRCKYSPSP